MKAPFSDIHLCFTYKKCVFEYSDSILFFNPTSKLGLKCRNLKRFTVDMMYMMRHMSSDSTTIIIGFLVTTFKLVNIISYQNALGLGFFPKLPKRRIPY